MKRWFQFAVMAGLLVPQLGAQDKAPYDLDTLLRDSAYVLNRFEEVSAGVAAQIDVKYPAGVKETSKGALSAVLRNVEAEKPALNALLGHRKVSSVDLFDVYAEIVEVASELEGEASSSANWGDDKMATDLAQLGAKASILGAKIGATLRSQVAAQELQLASCSPKPPAKANQ